MSNLAIVDVLLCTRPGRSLLNKLQIYISCATSSLQTELYRNSGLISQLSQKHDTTRTHVKQHDYAISTNTAKRSPPQITTYPQHRLLLLHSMDLHHRPSPQYIRHRLYMARRNSTICGPTEWEPSKHRLSY